MDKLEAYTILNSTLQEYSSSSIKELDLKVGKVFSLDEYSETGRLYSISIRVEKRENNTYRIFGSIHDNNPQKFDLLEEEILVKF